MTPADELRAMADALDAGGSLESLELRDENDFGLKFHIPESEMRTRARLAWYVLRDEGKTDIEAAELIRKVLYQSAATDVPFKIIKNKISRAIIDDADERYGTFSDAERDRISFKFKR